MTLVNMNKKKNVPRHLYGGLNLSSIPDQPLIPSRYPSSTKLRFMGIKKYNRSRYEAKIKVGAKNEVRLGIFETEVEAASVYARASLYVEQQWEKILGPNKPFIIDLSDVPSQTLILRSKEQLYNNPEISNYVGVTFDKKNQKWFSRICIKGRGEIKLGNYETQEEAADRYARADFKYREQGNEVNNKKQYEWIKEEKRQKQQVLKLLGMSHDEEGASKYALFCYRRRKQLKANRHEPSALLAAFFAYTRSQIRILKSKNTSISILEIAKELSDQFFELPKQEVDQLIVKGIDLQQREPYTSCIFGRPRT